MAWSNHWGSSIKRFDTFILRYNYFRSDYDSCEYFRNLSNFLFVYLLLYVDDMLIASKNMFKINIFKNQLSGESEMKDLGITK